MVPLYEVCLVWVDFPEEDGKAFCLLYWRGVVIWLVLFLLHFVAIRKEMRYIRHSKFLANKSLDCAPFLTLRNKKRR